MLNEYKILILYASHIFRVFTDIYESNVYVPVYRYVYIYMYVSQLIILSIQL